MGMYIDDIDELDEKILETIMDNARLTYSEIGEKVGVSRVSVKNRMDAMEDKGIIKGYKTVIDEEASPEGVKFYVDLELDPQYYEDALEFIAGETALREVYIVTGECRVHAIGITSNSRNISNIAGRLFRGSKGIKRVVWYEQLSTIKSVDGGIDYVRYQEPEHLEEGQSESTSDDAKRNEGNQ